MRIKKTRKAGTCAAQKCKNPTTDLLCEPCTKAWEAEGSPELSPGTSLLPLKVQNELANERTNLMAAIQRAKALPLETQEDVDRAGRIAGLAKARIKTLEEQRTSVTGPLNDAVSTINSWFRPLRESCQAVADIIEDRVRDRVAELKDAQRKALQAVQDAGGQASAETLMVAHATPHEPENMSFRPVKVPKIKDFAALEDKYKEPNWPAIRAAVKAGTIPAGVELIEESRGTTRSV